MPRLTLPLLLTWTLASTPIAAAQGCDTPVAEAQLQQLIDEAIAAYGSLDIAQFTDRSDALRAALPCLATPISPAVAAETHRVQGMRSFIDKQPVRATQSFGAARRLQPDFRFADEIVPEGNPLLDDYLALDVSAAPTASAPRPADGALYFDGEPGAPRPETLPTIAQLATANGAVTYSAYLLPRAALPEYAIAKDRPARVVSAGTKTARTGLLAGAGGAAVASAVLLGVSAASRSAWTNQPVDGPSDVDDLDRLRARTNSTAVAGSAAAVTAAGLGVGAALVGRF